MITLTEQKDGSLLISLKSKEDFKELLKRDFNDERQYLLEMMEDARYIGNNWDCLFNIGLTDAPAIGYGFIYTKEDEEGEDPDFEKIWWFSDYMTIDFLKVLEIDGEVTFIQAK